jgi:hypothetical protein
VSNQKQNSFTSWLYNGALFVGIVGVFLLFVNYGLGLLYPGPEYEYFCDNRTAQPTQDLTKSQCEAGGGKWYERSGQSGGTASATVAVGPTSTQRSDFSTSSVSATGYCDRDYECRENYESAQETHDRTAFAILSVLGLAAAFWGLTRKRNSILSVSATAAGILLILIATARFWNQAEDWLQFGLLFVALAVFVYFGYQNEQNE